VGSGRASVPERLTMPRRLYVPMKLVNWTSVEVNGENLKGSPAGVPGLLLAYSDRAQAEQEWPGTQIVEIETQEDIPD
jgi:hypothetical protein